MAFNISGKKEDTNEKEKLIESINNVKDEIKRNENIFNLTVNPDMIDFAIHTDLALKAQYNYLLKKYKETV